MKETPDIRVRVATPNDLDQVMQLSVAAVKENGVLPSSTESILRIIWGPLNQDHGIIGCIGAPGAFLEGMVVLNIGTISYSDTPCLEERTVYVRPEYRSAQVGRGRKLVEFSKSASDILGLPLLIGVLSLDRTKAKCKLYERIFGPAAGAFWVYGAKLGNKVIA